MPSAEDYLELPLTIEQESRNSELKFLFLVNVFQLYGEILWDNSDISGQRLLLKELRSLCAIMQ
jgi:hypothetical protein